MSLSQMIIDLNKENMMLKKAIIDCLNVNRHLADVENCTLIELKRVLKHCGVDFDTRGGE